MAGSCSGTDGQSQGNLQFDVVKGTQVEDTSEENLYVTNEMRQIRTFMSCTLLE